MPVRIAVDVLGSGTPPRELISATLQVAREEPHEFHVLATQEELVRSRGDLSSLLEGRCHFLPVQEEISMEEDPLSSLRKKKGASLIVGLQMLSAGSVDAFVSAGNTGALIAAAKRYLPLPFSRLRPALLTTLPKKEGDLVVLDVGANATYEAEHLLQFAKWGVAYLQARFQKKKLRVGLLNMGEEIKKGPLELQRAHALLEKVSFSFFDFVGNIEPHALFESDLDLLVTDGFTGNIFLKSCEGTAKMIFAHLESSSLSELTSQGREFTYLSRSEALIAGVQGTVVKCHGNPTSLSFQHALRQTLSLAEMRISEKMVAAFQEHWEDVGSN